MDFPNAVVAMWWSTTLGPGVRALYIAKEGRTDTYKQRLVQLAIVTLTVWYYADEMNLIRKLIGRLMITRPLLVIGVSLPTLVHLRYPNQPTLMIRALVASLWLRLLDRPRPMDRTELQRRSVVAVVDKMLGWDNIKGSRWTFDSKGIWESKHGQYRLGLTLMFTWLIIRLVKYEPDIRLLPKKLSLPSLPKLTRSKGDDAGYDCEGVVF